MEFNSAFRGLKTENLSVNILVVVPLFSEKEQCVISSANSSLSPGNKRGF
jgi:hypothetical protein